MSGILITMSKTKCIKCSNNVGPKGDQSQKICGRCLTLRVDLSGMNSKERHNLKKVLQQTIDDLDKLDTEEIGFKDKETRRIWSSVLEEGEPFLMPQDEEEPEEDVWYDGHHLSDAFSYYGGGMIEDKHDLTVNQIKELITSLEDGIDWSTATNPSDNRDFIRKNVFDGTDNDGYTVNIMVASVKTKSGQKMFFAVQDFDTDDYQRVQASRSEHSLEESIFVMQQKLEAKMAYKEKHSDWGLKEILKRKKREGIPISEADEIILTESGEGDEDENWEIY